MAIDVRKVSVKKVTTIECRYDVRNGRESVILLHKVWRNTSPCNLFARIGMYTRDSVSQLYLNVHSNLILMKGRYPLKVHVDISIYMRHMR